MKLLKLFIPLALILGYLILISYPYIFSKISKHNSLGLLSVVDEMGVDIQRSLNKERVTDKFDDRLFKGEKVVAEFRASENNLGILLFRFSQMAAIVKDRVVFRIKEKRSPGWYYEHEYKADQFQPNQYFTFGFPSISNSKDRIYIFEIESLAGVYNNGIGVSNVKPQVAAVYKFSKGDLRNTDALIAFISKKLIYMFSNLLRALDWQIITLIISPFLIAYLIGKNKLKVPKKIKPLGRKKTGAIVKRIKGNMVKILKQVTRNFSSSRFYHVFLDTHTKKRVAITLLIFLFAFLYRFSASLVLLDKLFYVGLGSQNDYDQLIRAGTCTLKSFCSLLLTQNLFVGSSILGVFYELFGFSGGLTAHLNLMMIISSIVATLPYILLSRKNWFSVGGIVGGIFIASSDYITHIALNYPPDNGSLFLFSMFFVVYLVAMNIRTVRWLLLFGLIGFIDGMYKALFLIGDLVALGIFVPAFFYESIRKQKTKLFDKRSLLFASLSIVPLLVFTVLYSLWEYIIRIKFSAVYFLMGLIQSGGSVFVSYTVANETTSKGNILQAIGSLSISPVVMVQRLIEYSQLQTYLIGAIFLGLLFVTFNIPRFSVKKIVITSIFSVLLLIVLMMIKNNYFGIHELFSGDYISTNWVNQTYINIFLFFEIVFLFILNFKYSAIKLSLPIIPYALMLVVLTQNSPFPRLWVHLVVWTIILLALLTDFIFTQLNQRKILRSISVLQASIIILFIVIIVLPKSWIIIENLYSGINYNRQQFTYLQWVNQNLPERAVVLAGGKSDLRITLDDIDKPVVYSALWTGALLIKPNEMPSISPQDFTIVEELLHKDNFKKKRYFILENDIYIWRSRVAGIGDGVFTSDPNTKTALHGNDYVIEIYNFNPVLNKGIYELILKETNNL